MSAFIPKSNFNKCGTCGEYAWFPGHSCPPFFSVRDQDSGPDDWTSVRAHDAEEAAERFVARQDSAESELSEERNVIVRDPAGDYHAYTVYGEWERSYRSEDGDFEIVEDPDDEEAPDEAEEKS